MAGWVLADVIDRVAGRSVPVPWTAPATLAILAVALVFWAVGMRRRLREKRVDPFVAARTAALALAASRTGVAGLLMVAAALWLERICRIKGDGDDDDDGTNDADSAADWVHPRVG